MSADPVHAAASVVLLRGVGHDAQVLMGKRNAAAVFMPSKYVFPGGRVDICDHAAQPSALLGPDCTAALRAQTRASCPAPHVLAAAALREMHEETGLRLAPAPRGGALRFIFRAITPQRPNQPQARRFDARFFLADVSDFAGDWHSFSAASTELSDLQWHSLPRARDLDLPFITRVILAEVAQICTKGAPNPAAGVPFFDNFGAQSVFRRL